MAAGAASSCLTGCCAGLLQYRYPGARLGASDGSSKRFDTTELYLGATHGGWASNGLWH
jgi:hypothetical protein